MLTKNEIAKDINFTADMIGRSISLDYKLDLTVGDLYDNQGNAESWLHGGYFNIENDREYEYTFLCRNVPCHKVDYDNEDEVEELNAVEDEQEVLLPLSAILKIVSVATDHDYEEMGYYEIELEFVGFREE